MLMLYRSTLFIMQICDYAQQRNKKLQYVKRVEIICYGSNVLRCVNVIRDV